MKPFITWKKEKHATCGMAGNMLFFTITKVSNSKDRPAYDLNANIIGKHISYYRSEEDAKLHAELAVEHFLKELGFWKCIVDRESQGA